jgi:hypothetical protein
MRLVAIQKNRGRNGHPDHAIRLSALGKGAVERGRRLEARLHEEGSALGTAAGKARNLASDPGLV